MLSYLPDDILTKVDRASMAVSLEVRVPLLDHRVVEFAWTLPSASLVRNGKGKRPLRAVLDRYVPRALTERPKMGFGVPIGEWLRGSLRPWAEELLSPAALASTGLINAEIARGYVEEHMSGRRNWQYALWTLLQFQAWQRSYAASI
jgi:asparagine synthase (glutamine-hydrolysing)